MTALIARLSTFALSLFVYAQMLATDPRLRATRVALMLVLAVVLFFVLTAESGCSDPVKTCGNGVACNGGLINSAPTP